MTSGDVTRERIEMDHEEAWKDENVLLSVPLRYIDDVARYKAALIAGAGTQPAGVDSVDGDRAVTVEGQGVWSPTMIGRVADAVSYDAVLALLDHCASQPGQWIPKAEVEEAGGFSAIQLRNELGAFSKKAKKLFGEAIWPMEWKKQRGAYYYRLNPLVAEWWTDARAKSEDLR
jgi:hypothetical protein